MFKIPEDISKKIISLKSVDLKNEKLGTDSNFIEADNVLKLVITLTDSILEIMPKFFDKLPEPIIQNHFNIIRAKLNYLEQMCNRIASIIGNGIHNPDFPNQRRAQLNEFEETKKNAIPELFSIKSQYLLLSIEEDFYSSNDLSEKITITNKNLSETQKQLDEAIKIIGDVRGVSFIKSLKESAGSFEKLRINHSKSQRNWFISFLTFSIIVIISVLHILSNDYNLQTIYEALAGLIKKILILGLPIIGMRISLKKYNLERNLKIIYDHRATILEQFKHFENAIGDDKEAKNTFRIEIAKYLFTDPITGYVQDNSTPDLSVNPVVSIVEKLVSKP